VITGQLPPFDNRLFKKNGNPKTTAEYPVPLKPGRIRYDAWYMAI
jgi:hypothetical protein